MAGLHALLHAFFKASLFQYEWGEYLRRGRAGEHDAMLLGVISDTGDPSDPLENLSCRAVRDSNFSKWCYQPYDDLIQRAAQMTDMAQRARLYRQAQEIFKREQPFTSIAYPTVYQPINKNVTGFKIHPLGLTAFYGVGLKQ